MWLTSVNHAQQFWTCLTSLLSNCLEKQETQIDEIIEISMCVCVCACALTSWGESYVILRFVQTHVWLRWPGYQRAEVEKRAAAVPTGLGAGEFLLPGRHGGTARGGRCGHLPGCPNFRAGSCDLCGSAGGEAHYSRWQSLTSCMVLEVASGAPLSRKGTFGGKKKKKREMLKQNTLRMLGYYFIFLFKNQLNRRHNDPSQRAETEERWVIAKPSNEKILMCQSKRK